MGNYGSRVISGPTDEYDRAGYSVSGIGDFNGDGIEDFAVTARNGETPSYNGDFGKETGTVYIVYGTEDADLRFDLDDIDGTNGFQITSDYYVSDYNYSSTFGSKVVGLGDVNGDGVDDFGIVENATSYGSYGYYGYYGYGYNYIPSRSQGVAYVIYGGQTVEDAQVTVTDFDHFRLDAEGEITDMISLGDIDGDGVADIGVTAQSRNQDYSGYINDNYTYDANSNGYYDYDPDTNPDEYQNSYTRYVAVADVTSYIVYGTESDETRDDYDPIADPGNSDVIVNLTALDENDGMTIFLGQNLEGSGFYGEFGAFGQPAGAVGVGGYDNYDYGIGLDGSVDIDGDGFDDILTRPGSVYVDNTYRYNTPSGDYSYYGGVFADSNTEIISGADGSTTQVFARSFSNEGEDGVAALGNFSGDDAPEEVAFSGFATAEDFPDEVLPSSFTRGVYVLNGRSDIFDTGSVQIRAAEVLAGEGSFFYSSATYYNSFNEAEFQVNFDIAGILGVGDTTGDGIDDLLILTERYDNELTLHIGAYLVKGTSDVRTGVFDLEQMVADGDAYLYLSDYPDGEIFFAPAGDVDNDGIADILVGNSRANNGDGEVIVIHGGTDVAEAMDNADGTNDNRIDTQNAIVDVDTGLVPIEVNMVSTFQIVTEGDTNPVDVTFTISRSGNLTAGVSVDWEVRNGGYSSLLDTSDDDFEGGVLPFGTVDFAPGSATATITVQIAGDTIDEPTEDFTVVLTDATTDSDAAIYIATSTAGAYINDNDDPVSFSVSNAFVTEGQNGTESDLTFTVTRSGRTNVEASVDFSLEQYVSSNSADVDDFASGFPQSGTLEFGIGETTKTITARVLDDLVFEPLERVQVTLSNAQADGELATISVATGLGYITDDDQPVRFSAFGVNVEEGDDGEVTNMVIRVNRSGETGVAATLDYTVQPFVSSQAADDDDIVGSFNLTGTLEFAANDLFKDIVVEIQGDDIVEQDEFIQVLFSNPTADGTEVQLDTGSVTGRIRNDDFPVQFSASYASATEGASGAETPLTFTITRSGEVGVDASVDYVIRGYQPNPAISAESPDFDGNLPFTGTVLFGAGEVQKTVTLQVLDDDVYEQTEYVELLLSNPVAADHPTGAEIISGYARGDIFDDEIPVYFRVFNDSVIEGEPGETTTLQFLVQRSGDTTVAASVDYSVSTYFYSGATDADLNETMPLPITGTVEFGVGETSKFVEIEVAGDDVVEGTEYLQIDLSNGGSDNADVSPVILTSRAYGYINDDDIPTYFRVSGSTTSEGDLASDAREMTFTVTRYGDTSAAASVDYDISGGTVSSNDFETGEWPTSGTLSFAVGETVKTVRVAIAEDQNVESDEYTYMNLSNATSDDAAITAQITTARAYATIRNDDFPAYLQVSGASVEEGDSSLDARALSFTISRSGDTTSTVTVDYSFTGDGYAPVASDDFEAGLPQSGTVTFNGGETTKTVSFAILEDEVIESSERGRMTLSNAQVVTGDDDASAIISRASATATIYNDDQPPCIRVLVNGSSWGAFVNEGNSGLTDVTLTFVREGNLSGNLTVDYELRTGSGIFSADDSDIAGFLPAYGLSVDFEDGQSTATATVSINGDGIIEANESFSVVVTGYDSSDNIDYTVKNPNSTITIGNDDGRPPIPELPFDVDGDGVIEEGEFIRVEADVFGDPHIVTLDGLGYDFQAVGEYVLVETVDGAVNPFSVQVRFEPFPGSDLVSVTSRMAVQVKGKTVEVDAFNPASPLMVDGVAVDMDQAAFSGIDLDGDATNANDIFVDEDGKIFIRLNEAGELLMVGLLEGALNVCVFLGDPNQGGNAGAVRGLMGNANQDLTDDFQLRDGADIPEDAISFDDAGVPSLTFDFVYGFGDYAGGGYKASWALNDGERVFSDELPEFPDNFPAGPVNFDELPESVRQAALLAADEAGITDPVLRKAAVLDFALTGENDFVMGASQLAADPETGSETTENPETAPSVGVAANLTQVTEGDDGVLEVTFTFYRLGNTDSALNVDYSIGGDIDAADLADGTELTGSVSFDAGEGEQTVTILVKGDLATESDEALSVSITGTDDEAVLVAGSQGLTMIRTDDFGPEAEDDAASGAAGGTVEGNVFEDNGQGEDADADGDALAVTAVFIEGVAYDPADGPVDLGNGRSLTVDEDGDFQFVAGDAYNSLAKGSVETFSFDYEVSDGNGGADRATVTIAIAGALAPEPERNDGLDNDLDGDVDEDFDVVALVGDGVRFFATGAAALRIVGDAGDNTIVAADGPDVISAGAGSDVVIGGLGEDVLIGQAGADVMTGGADADVFVIDSGDYFGSGFEADFITDFEAGVDRLEISGFGPIDLGSALDLPTGAGIALGNNKFVVLEGYTVADLAAIADDIVATDAPRNGAEPAIGPAQELTDRDERWIASDDLPADVSAGGGEDVVVTGAAADTLRGEAGSDVLVAGAGADLLVGGAGSDELTGGADADTFMFLSGEETGFASDFITDFELGTDMVMLSGYNEQDFATLNFVNLPGGLGLQLEATRFVVFEGYSDPVQFEAETFLQFV